MNILTFIQLRTENTEQHAIFEKLMWQYTKELDEHRDRTTPVDLISKWIQSIIRIQGDEARHLELCYDDKTLIGFLYGKIDRPGHKSFIKIGYGYIMEFFVLPEYRRRGYGKKMYLHLEKIFHKDGAKRIYLTADPVTGKPFWESLGFVNTGEISPDNQLYIYEKSITSICFDNGILRPLTKAFAAEISNWEYEYPYDIYNFKGSPNGWLMNESTWGTEQFCLIDGKTILGQVACQLDGTALWVG